MTKPRKTADHYRIGIVTALHIELTAMVAMLDEAHEAPIGDRRDPNSYVFGSLSGHDVVISCLPASIYGNASAANVATHMLRSFPIHCALMVGVGGGVWSRSIDVRLGDVVVSQPNQRHGGLVQWDLGRTEQGGTFKRVGQLDKPPAVLLRALAFLQSKHALYGHGIDHHLSAARHRYPRNAPAFTHPNLPDVLFRADYEHTRTGDLNCESCLRERVEPRPSRGHRYPYIHYGNIATGDKVMKHGLTRDQVARDEDIICFEMEAAGVSAAFPCLVIRGICDYADSHKNQYWQPYAASTAAAYAKEVMSVLNDSQNIMVNPGFTAPPTVAAPVRTSTPIRATNNAGEDLATLVSTLTSSDQHARAASQHRAQPDRAGIADASGAGNGWSSNRTGRHTSRASPRRAGSVPPGTGNGSDQSQGRHPQNNGTPSGEASRSVSGPAAASGGSQGTGIPPQNPLTAQNRLVNGSSALRAPSHPARPSILHQTQHVAGASSTSNGASNVAQASTTSPPVRRHSTRAAGQSGHRRHDSHQDPPSTPTTTVHPPQSTASTTSLASQSTTLSELVADVRPSRLRPSTTGRPRGNTGTHLEVPQTRHDDDHSSSASSGSSHRRTKSVSHSSGSKLWNGYVIRKVDGRLVFEKPHKSHPSPFKAEVHFKK